MKKETTPPQVEIKNNKNLSLGEKRFINKARVDDFGEKHRKDFSKDYEPNTKWFFVKVGKKIVSFGGIRSIKVNYLGKTYNIGGICSTISIEKMKGYGRIMVHALIDYSKKTGKTILGFTDKTKFFGKVGLKIKKDFIKRFIYKNPETGKEIIDNSGDGIYYEGRDKFVSKVLKNKKIVYIDVLHW